MFWLGLSLGCLGLLMCSIFPADSGPFDPARAGSFQQVPAADVRFVPADSVGRHHLYEWMKIPRSLSTIAGTCIPGMGRLVCALDHLFRHLDCVGHGAQQAR